MEKGTMISVVFITGYRLFIVTDPETHSIGNKQWGD